MCPYCYQKVHDLKQHLAECPALDESTTPPVTSPQSTPRTPTWKRKHHKKFKHIKPHEERTPE
jgi:hypothetical protein